MVSTKKVGYKLSIHPSRSYCGTSLQLSVMTTISPSIRALSLSLLHHELLANSSLDGDLILSLSKILQLRSEILPLVSRTHKVPSVAEVNIVLALRVPEVTVLATGWSRGRIACGRLIPATFTDAPARILVIVIRQLNSTPVCVHKDGVVGLES
jgi:hypothetical protein